MRYALLVLLTAGLLTAGCSDAETPSATGSNSPDQPTDAATDPSSPQDAGQQTAAKKKKSSVSGNWLLVASRMDEPKDSRIAIVKLDRQPQGRFSGKVLDSSERMFPDARLTTTEVTGDRVHLVFQVGEGGRLDVEGQRDGDVIYGNAPTNAGLQPVRLVRTTATELDSPAVVPSPAADAFEAAVSSDDTVAALQEFAGKHPQSPAALSAYLRLLASSKIEELKQPVVEQIIQDFVKAAKRWGTRMEQNARLDSAGLLVQQKYLPDLAVKILEPLEPMLNEGEESLTARFRLTSALGKVLSSDRETSEAGGQELESLLKESPLNHRLRVALAQYHEQADNKQAALQRYTELAVLPEGERYLAGLTQDSGQEPESAVEASARLWTAIHGKEEGIEGYRRQTYHDVIERVFVSQPAATPASPEDRQTALVELFTGSSCPPCVAADMATVGLEATFPKSSLIVLRYHQHIPMPDPLTNADGETRFAYYEGQGTPTVILNGRPVPGIAGPFAYSEIMYEELRARVDDALTKTSDLKIQLDANAHDGQLTISANVEGAAGLPETAVLRLVLAEDSIEFPARNDVNRHEMVVRYMPGGPDGIARTEGRLAYSATLDLATIKQGLLDYLANIEQQFGDPRGLPPQLAGGPFPVKPLALKPLHLIAFVQDDASQQVLQAAAIPVGGRLEYPQAADAEPAPADTSAARAAGDNGAVLAPVPAADAGDKENGSGAALPPAPKGKETAAAGPDKSGPRLVPQGTESEE